LLLSATKHFKLSKSA